MAQKRLIAGLLWSLGHLHSFEALTRVPTQVTCRIFKKLPGRWGQEVFPRKGGAKYKRLTLIVNPFFGLVLRRFVAFAAGADQLEGAQYSQGLWAVNVTSQNNYSVNWPRAAGP